MLNLPDVIYSDDEDKFLKFSYLSDGTKLSMTNHMDSGVIYVGSMIYYRIGTDIVLGGANFDGGRFYASPYSGETDFRFFVTDHLGSVRRVLDGNLELVEENNYYPFGKRIDDPDCVTTDNLYRYNGKESLESFGFPYSDYGARLFDSNIGRWLQTDPLAQDYPNINPYAFCANNPMNVIDPNGMDIWELDNMGNVINYTRSSDMDAFYIVENVDGSWERTGQELIFEYGTVSGYRKPVVHDTITQQDYKITMFEIKGDDNATKLFEFLANPAVTTVEWGHVKVGAEESGRNLLGTINHESASAINSYALQTGYTIRESNHNHPSNCPFASVADVAYAKELQAKFPNAKLNVFIAQPPIYLEYDKRTLPQRK